MKTLFKHLGVILSLTLSGQGLAQQEEPAAPARAELRYHFEIAADKLVEFTIAGNINNGDEKIRQIARCLANMPPQHRQHIVPIYVVPTLPGGRTTGAGWYPNNDRGGANLRAWLNRQSRTGIPNSVIEEDIERNVSGIVAVTHSRFEPSTSRAGTRMPAIHYISALHEMAHAVQAAGAELTQPEVTIGQLAQVYPLRNVREHAADAYSRLITRPTAICRQRALPSGENVASCTRRVEGLLRAGPAFEQVDRSWRPLPGCHNNTALDQVASAEPSTPTPVAGEESGHDEESGQESEQSESDSNNEEASSGQTASGQDRLPQGKGLFFRPQEFVRSVRQGGQRRIVFDVDHLGTPAEFVARMTELGIRWVALPRNARARIFTDNVQRELKPYADAMNSADPQIQIFVWNGGPESHTDYENQIDRMVETAVEWGAKGIIVDPEGRTWHRARNARNLVAKARAAAQPHNFSVGYTDFRANRSWRGSAISEYSQLDYGMPQIYDRFESQPSSYPARKIETWQQEFDVVIPLSGLHQCDDSPDDDRCHSPRPKTESQVRRLLSETDAPNGALGWWTHDFMQNGDLATPVGEHQL